MPGIIFPHYRNKLCKEHIFCKWVYLEINYIVVSLHHMHTPWHKQMCHCSRLEETVCTYVHVHKTKVLYSQSFWGVVNLYCRVCTRCLMVSNNQADPSCFYFRISCILMERRWFYFFRPLHLMQGLRSLEHWLLQKISMTILDQKFRFFIKKQVFLCSNISRTWIFCPLKIQL